MNNEQMSTQSAISCINRKLFFGRKRFSSSLSPSWWLKHRPLFILQLYSVTGFLSKQCYQALHLLVSFPHMIRYVHIHSSFSLGLRLLDPNIEDDRITNVPTRPVHAQFRTEREKLVVLVSYIHVCVHFTDALMIISNFSYCWSPLLYPQISPHIVKDYTAARNHVISCWSKTDSTSQ